MSPRVALATCSAFPGLYEDEVPLLTELRARGIGAEPVVWDDPGADWSAYALTVIRSTWDYAPRREEFLAWARAVPRLLNSAEVITWNTDKRYLGELRHAIATRFLAPGEAFDAPATVEFVVKPSISAGARDTARYAPEEAARAREHVRALHGAGRTVMVQPYLEAVDDRGETALLYFNGEYSHAIRKGQILEAGRGPTEEMFAPEDIRLREPSGLEREVADATLDALAWPRADLLYARVDLIAGLDGSPRVVELELTEPSLFLSYAPDAAKRLADAVIARL